METCDVTSALHALLEGREPRCAPWWCWLAVGLCRQRVAQAWLTEVAPTLDDEDGPVPGHPGWRATFHGRGLCLEGPEGALVDMDFGDHAGEDIDPWFFAQRVDAMQGGVEAEVRRWFGSEGALVAGLEALRRDGHLWHPTSAHVFRLSSPLEAMAAKVDALAKAKRLSELLGRADESPGEGAHEQWLISLLSDRTRAYGAVATMARILRRDAFVALLPKLLSSADHLAAATLEQCDLLGLDAAALAAPLLDEVTDGRHPFIGAVVCRHLLSHDVETPRALNAVRSLAAVVQVKGYTSNPMLDRLAFLLLEFGDELEARRVVRRALRGAPACAEAVAELLSLLQTRWALED